MTLYSLKFRSILRITEFIKIVPVETNSYDKLSK
jgi:hypothetical protein